MPLNRWVLNPSIDLSCNSAVTQIFEVFIVLNESSTRYVIKFVAIDGYAVSLCLPETPQELTDRCNFLEIDSPSSVVCLKDFRVDPEIELSAQEFDHLIKLVAPIKSTIPTRLTHHRIGDSCHILLNLFVPEGSLNDYVKRGEIPLQFSESAVRLMLFDVERLTQLIAG